MRKMIHTKCPECGAEYPVAGSCELTTCHNGHTFEPRPAKQTDSSAAGTIFDRGQDTPALA